ncbi:HlyD family efflux transporter periplasmic adaptor subunit [Nostoc sp. MG11]|uniref:HlyD family efflux transporter periplasmic adaptor subunit n=1 Tax=Nostoc sp. MG11 TaxID=2721166 RepID=UPI0018682F83|nr:HlyD family efflux transporter periplasmic adaptor subunit [Nostoc sp. MG11]
MGKLQRLTIILSIVSVCTACNATQQNSTPDTSVKPAPVASVVALGRIEPEGEVIKVSVANAQDSRVNRILVKEGDFVKANQIIAILQGIDSSEAALRDALAEMQLRKAELTKVQQGEAKKAQLRMQEAAIARLQAQVDTEVQQRKAVISSAEAALYEAQLTFERRQTLANQGAISRADRDVAQRELATAQATLVERKADLEQTTKTLSAEITQEKERLAELLEVRPVDIKIAQLQFEKARIAVEQRKADLENTKVRAPIAGQILRINTRIGEQVNTDQGIVELAQTNHMFAVAEISETDIGKVRPGQRATITSEYGGFPNEIRGAVEYIGLQIGRKSLQDAAAANSPTTDQNARIVAVKVRIDKQDNPKVAGLTNMQVRVKLNLQQINQVSAKN